MMMMMMMMQKFKSNFEFCDVHEEESKQFRVSSKKGNESLAEFPPRASFFLQEREKLCFLRDF